MLHSSGNIRGRSPSSLFALCFTLVLLLCAGRSHASVYHMKGTCSYKEKHHKPGDLFWRGCDKCVCHDFGFYCFPPTTPTSWPKKCLRVRTECSYKVVYKENPMMKCRAYSWIG